MTEYRRTLKLRALFFSAAAVCIAAAYLVLFFFPGWLPAVPDFTKGFQAGAFLSLEFILVFLAIKYFHGMRSDKALKKLYVGENDERRNLILQKAGSTGMQICSIGLAGAAVVGGFFNQSVFFSLLGATLFVSCVRGILKLYYIKKY